MPPVRLFILVLALVLLPLRGWLEGAMAVEVTTAAAMSAPGHAHEADAFSLPVQPAVAMTTEAAEASAHCHESQAASVGGDAHGAHAHDVESPAPGHHGDDSGTAHDHGYCGLCQICHSVAMTDAMQAALPAPPARVQPQGHAPHFASALLAQADKPPIS
ncbi:hypothetical protein SAMN05880557_10186 [Pseudacidovorax sp. RU35E]|nr:hypothetical protein SAMN05880557_10186 [Pseudacidovorax sp. RU35E]